MQPDRSVRQRVPGRPPMHGLALAARAEDRGPPVRPRL